MDLGAALGGSGEADEHGILDELGEIDREGESRDGRANSGIRDKNLKNAMVVELDPRVNKIAAFQVDAGGVKIGDQRGDHTAKIDADVVAIDVMKLDVHKSIKFNSENRGRGRGRGVEKA